MTRTMRRGVSPTGGWPAALLCLLAIATGARAEWPRLQRLIEASRDATVELEPIQLSPEDVIVGRGARPVPRPAPLVPPGDWPSPRPATPGRIIPRDAKDKPLCLQPLDDGRILVGTERALELIDSAGGSGTRVLLEAGARNIAPDQTGGRLLVTTCGEPPFVILDARTLGVTSRIEGRFGGAVAWWGENAGELLLVREAIDFTGQMERRIHTLLETLPESGGEPKPMGWPIDAWARVGTIAPQGVFWGIPSRPWQVDPVPGSLLSLEGTRVRGPLVEPSPWADTRPAGGRDGRLYWIRTREPGSNAGRLMMKAPDDAPGAARQLTAEATWLVGVSPSGDAVAWFSGGDGAEELHLSGAAELDRVDAGAMAAADEELARRWRAANRRLAEVFAQTTVAGALTTNGPVPILTSQPSWEDVDTLGHAFEQALEKDFGLDVGEPDLLPAADLVLSESAGYFGDGPIETLALGGFIMRECRRRGIGTSLPGAGSPTLSATQPDWAWTDESTMVLASPWAIARACMDRRLTPGWAVAELSSQGSLPVLWTDGFDSPAREMAREFLLGVAGLPSDEDSAAAFAHALELYPDCNLCARELARLGINQGMREQALEAAAHLAGRRPLSAEAFALLAEALLANAHPQEARRAMDWALALSPLDPALRFQSASMAFVLGDLDRSRREFGRVTMLPGGGAYEALAASRLALIAESAPQGGTP